MEKFFKQFNEEWLNSINDNNITNKEQIIQDIKHKNHYTLSYSDRMIALKNSNFEKGLEPYLCSKPSTTYLFVNRL